MEKTVANWLTVAGVESPSTPEFCSQDNFDLWFNLMLEELYETRDAFENKDMVEVRDGLADLFVVLENLYHFMGISSCIKEDREEVMRSNFSKFCTKESDALHSVVEYKKQGIEAHYVKVKDYYVILRSSDNKILKGTDYFKPQLNG